MIKNIYALSTLLYVLSIPIIQAAQIKFLKSNLPVGYLSFPVGHSINITAENGAQETLKFSDIVNRLTQRSEEENAALIQKLKDDGFLTDQAPPQLPNINKRTIDELAVTPPPEYSSVGGLAPDEWIVEKETLGLIGLALLLGISYLKKEQIKEFILSMWPEKKDISDEQTKKLLADLIAQEAITQMAQGKNNILLESIKKKGQETKTAPNSLRRPKSRRNQTQQTARVSTSNSTKI